MTEQEADLAVLFAGASLTAQLPASASPDPPTVFFDELLKVNVRLALPEHPRLPVYDQSDVEVQLPLGRENHLTVPTLLRTFLACLHVSLFADYVPLISSTPASMPTHVPFATVRKERSAFQLLPENSAQQSASSVRDFAASWCGIERSDGSLSTLRPPQRYVSEPEDATYSASVRAINNIWVMQWKCPVPINFVATPFEPLLAVTAALTLRLDPAQLRTAEANPHLRSGFSHSLLTPLHEGPIYPDESRSQSAARASAASALGLDGPHGLGTYLADLPKEVIGGTSAIVTPKTGILALRAILRRQQDALTAQSTSDSVGSSVKPLDRSVDSNGDLATAVKPKTSANGGDAKLSGAQTPALRVYKRSTREVVNLKTGLNVRMRTLYTTHDPFQATASSDLLATREDSASQPTGSTSLVLCVELENPFDSGILFTVSDIKIRIHPPSPVSPQQPSQLHATLLSYKSEDRFPILLSQGQQHNLLYYLSSSADITASVTSGSMGTGDTARNVTILVSGCPRPLNIAATDPTNMYADADSEAVKYSNDFESQWNCTLDIRPLLANTVTPRARTSTQPRSSIATAT